MGFWHKKVEYRTSDTGAGAGSAVDLGKVKQDSSHSPETAQEENSDGGEMYGGTQDAYELQAYDLTKKAGLRTIMLADGLVDLRFTDAEGNVGSWEEGFSVIVSEPKQFSPRTRAFFNARFVKSSV